MPLTDEDIVRHLLQRYTAAVFPDAAVASGVAGRQRRKEIRRRAGSAVAAGAALGVAAGVVAGVHPGSSGPAEATDTTGATPGRTATASAPAITLTVGQRVLYQLSAAAAKQQPAPGRYVTVYEKTASVLAATVIDTDTGNGYSYEKGAILTPSRQGAVVTDISPTAAEFAAMPLDPAALRKYLIAHYEGPVFPQDPPSDPPTANDVIFAHAMSYLWNPSTPPDLRAALFRLLAQMPAVQVDPSAHDMLGRPAVKITWTASDTTVYAIYEDPTTGTVLEQAYKWPARMRLGPSYGLMLRVTRTNTIPPDPYTS